jgi:hypothetical protein
MYNDFLVPSSFSVNFLRKTKIRFFRFSSILKPTKYKALIKSILRNISEAHGMHLILP